MDVGGIPYPMLYGLKGGARMKARRYVKSSMVQQLQQQNNGTSTSSSCFRADEDAERCKPGMLCWNRNNGTERCTAEPLYVFSRVFPTDEDAERLLQDIPEISFLRYDDLPKENRGGASYMKRMIKDSMANSGTQIYLGPARSGAPVHFHDHAVNFLAHGYKRWLLWPPASSFWTTKHIGRWLAEDYETFEHRPLECRQGPGEVIYVPALWGHGVINLTPTAGFAQEFSTMFAVNPNSIEMLIQGSSSSSS